MAVLYSRNAWNEVDFHTRVVKGLLKPNAQQSLVVEREKPGEPCPTASLRFFSPTSQKMSEPNMAGGWAFV